MKQKLYRPVGKKELELIIGTKSKAYPPRLDWQPIFYPVLNYDYAAQIALDWNTKDEFSGYCGFVTEFEMDKAYLEQFEVQNVGGAMHNELWVPSEQLSDFNQQIIGHIQVTGAFYGENYVGLVEGSIHFANLNAQQQLDKLKEMPLEGISDLMEKEPNAFLINFSYWKNNLKEETFCNTIKETWVNVLPDLSLCE